MNELHEQLVFLRCEVDRLNRYIADHEYERQRSVLERADRLMLDAFCTIDEVYKLISSVEFQPEGFERISLALDVTSGWKPSDFASARQLRGDRSGAYWDAKRSREDYTDRDALLDDLDDVLSDPNCRRVYIAVFDLEGGERAFEVDYEYDDDEL